MIEQKPRVIRVEIREIAPGLFRTFSPDMPGLQIAAESEQKLIRDLPTVIEAMLKAEGLVTKVYEAEFNEGDMIPLVAMPIYQSVA